jgi:hypothetical protein
MKLQFKKHRNSRYPRMACIMALRVENRAGKFIQIALTCILLLLSSSESLFAQGGAFWYGYSIRPSGRGGWFSTAQDVCDAYLPESTQGEALPKMTFTFVHMDLSGDEEIRYAACYMRACYTYINENGKVRTLCGVVEYAASRKRYCPDQTEPDFKARECFRKFRLLSQESGLPPESHSSDPCFPQGRISVLSGSGI